MKSLHLRAKKSLAGAGTGRELVTTMSFESPGSMFSWILKGF